MAATQSPVYHGSPRREVLPSAANSVSASLFCINFYAREGLSKSPEFARSTWRATLSSDCLLQTYQNSRVRYIDPNILLAYAYAVTTWEVQGGSRHARECAQLAQKAMARRARGSHRIGHRRARVCAGERGEHPRLRPQRGQLLLYGRPQRRHHRHGE